MSEKNRLKNSLISVCYENLKKKMSKKMSIVFITCGSILSEYPLREACRTAGISEEEGLTVNLRRYNDEEGFRFIQGMGFKRG